MYCLKIRMKAIVLIKLPLEEITIYFCNKFTGCFFKMYISKKKLSFNMPNFILHSYYIVGSPQ